MKRLLAVLFAVILLPASVRASATCTGDTQWFSTTTMPVTAPPFTVSVWVKGSARATDDTMVFLGDSTTDDSMITVQVARTNSARASVWHRSGDFDGEAVPSSNTLTNATWQHILARVDSNSQRRIKVDDANEATNTAVQPSVTIDALSICRRNDSSPGQYWDGQIAEVAIWDAALSDANVTSLAGGANPLTIDASNLIAYWPLKVNVNDTKGTNHLTNNGSATFDGGDHPTVASARRRGAPIIFQ